MEMTLRFSTKERYNRAVHHLVNDCKDYRLNSRGKCLDGSYYGYVTFEELDRHFYVSCETCGKRFDLMDSNNCNVFPCDDCGDGYCPDCFIKRHGKADFDSMMDAWESYCPDCWPKYKQEIMSR